MWLPSAVCLCRTLVIIMYLCVWTQRPVASCKDFADQSELDVELDSRLLMDIYAQVEDRVDTSGLDNNCSCLCGLPNRGMRIVNGVEAKKNEFPWAVLLFHRGTFMCGGSLITRRHVLTAAHCVHTVTAGHMNVILGEHDRLSHTESETQTKGVQRISVHAGYNSQLYDNDIAILHLDSPVELNGVVRPICIPSPGTVYTGKIAIVAGWGMVFEQKEPSSVLRKVAVPVLSRDACLQLGYPQGRISDNMMCAGYKDGRMDSCKGDSGGGLVTVGSNHSGLEIAGVVSWGSGCSRPDLPGLYTKVTNYLDWIDSQLDGECLCPRVPRGSPSH